MKSLTSLVLSLSLAAGIAGCKRDYSFLGQKDAAGDITQRYDLGADNRVAADVDGDRNRKYDLGKDVAAIDHGRDAAGRDLGRDAPEIDGPRADGAVPDTLRSDRYAADLRGDTRQTYDAATIDAPHADRYSPDVGADRQVIIFPDENIPDLYADSRADALDLGLDGSRDLGADVFNPCPGEAPLNRLQAGVCAGSRNVCGAAGWQDDYSSVVGYEVNEVACDGLDNDCDGLEDLIEIFDDFDRPDQDGLGNNALGNPWTPYGILDDWDIEGGAAVTSWTGEVGQPRINNPMVTSRIGYRTTFNTYVKFRLSEVNNIGAGALMYLINSSSSSSDNGLMVRVAVNGPSEHIIYRDGADVAVGIQELLADTWYILQFSYDGSVAGVKIWEQGQVKPTDYLMSGVLSETDLSWGNIKFGGFLDPGETLTSIIDYVGDGCE